MCPLGPCLALWAWRTLSAGGTGRALRARITLRACRTRRTLCSRRPLRACRTGETLWTGITLWPLCSCGTRRALCAGRSRCTSRTLWAGITLWPRCTGRSLRARRAGEPLRTRISLWTGSAGGALWTLGSHITLYALWAGLSLRTGGPCGALGANVALRALRTGFTLRALRALRARHTGHIRRTCVQRVGHAYQPRLGDLFVAIAFRVHLHAELVRTGSPLNAGQRPGHHGSRTHLRMEDAIGVRGHIRLRFDVHRSAHTVDDAELHIDLGVGQRGIVQSYSRLVVEKVG